MVIMADVHPNSNSLKGAHKSNGLTTCTKFERTYNSNLAVSSFFFNLVSEFGWTIYSEPLHLLRCGQGPSRGPLDLHPKT